MPELGSVDEGAELQRVEERLVADLRAARAVARACGNPGGGEVEVDFRNGGGWERDAAGCPGGQMVERNSAPYDEVAVEIIPTGGNTLESLEFTYPTGELAEQEDVELHLAGEARVCVYAATGSIQRGACE